VKVSGSRPDERSRYRPVVRLVTWNVNSLKARLPRVEEFLRYADADVVCLQETKLGDAAFPHLTFQELGYDAVHFGQGQWNGVAILSRVGIDDAEYGLGADVEDPYEGDARLLWATCGGLRVGSVYVPNGRAVGTEFYDRKLLWLEALHDSIAKHHSPTEPIVLMGDFNVAPADIDVWDPAAFVESTHVTAPEREAVARLKAWGLVDLFRLRHPGVERLYSYWDYRAGDFHEHRGMRIDLTLGTGPIADRTTWAAVDRNARKGKQPSDHAPVVVDLD
jgi:exodeoxyribonuclease-3